MYEPVRVEGLRELQRSLRAVGPEAAKQLRLVGNQAAQVVVDVARPRIPVGPAAGGHAAGSIKVASSRTAVRVRAGSKRYPYYAWLDFGGRVGPARSVSRPFLKRGRYLWAAYADNDQRVAAQLAEGLAAAVADAGLAVD